MKTKEQKRSEAIERARQYYGRLSTRERTLEQYLDKFRTKQERQERRNEEAHRITLPTAWEV